MESCARLSAIFTLAALTFAPVFGETIVDVRGDACGIIPGDHAIAALVKIKDRIDAVRAADTGSVVRLFPLTLGDATAERDKAINREMPFFTHKEPRTRWFDEKARMPGYGDGSKIWSKDRNKFWWADRMKAKQAEIAALGGSCDLVFLGDSITHDWEREPGRPVLKPFLQSYKTLNLGYGGDGCSALLWRIRNGELDGYTTKGVMLMIGTNDRETPPEKIADNVGTILSVIREKQPQAKILLMAMISRIGEGHAKLRAKNDVASDLFRRYVDDKTVFWLDLRPIFMRPDGTEKYSLLPDTTHPSSQGERLWRDAAVPFFEKVTGKKFVNHEPPIEPIANLWINWCGGFDADDAARSAGAFAARAAANGYGAICLDAGFDACDRWDDATRKRFAAFRKTCRDNKLEIVPVVRSATAAETLKQLAEPTRCLVFTNAAEAAQQRTDMKAAVAKLSAALPDAEILVWANPFIRAMKDLPAGVTLVFGGIHDGQTDEYPRFRKAGWRTIMAPVLNRPKYDLHRTRCILRDYHDLPGRETAIYWTDIADYRFLVDFAEFVRDGADRTPEVPAIRFGVMTDNHHTDDPASLDRTRMALELFRREKLPVIVQLGDLGQYNCMAAYKRYRALVETTFPDTATRPEFLYVYADHERYNPKGAMFTQEEAFSRMREGTGITQPYFVERDYGAAHVLVFPECLRLIGGMKSYEEKIAAACKASVGRPLIVFDHIPPYETVYNSVQWGDRGLPHRKILNKYPQVISVTGHIHNSILNERCIWQGEFTAVDVGCLQRWQGLTVGSPLKSYQGFGVCILDVFPTHLVFHRYDVRGGIEDRTDNRWVVPFPFDPNTAPYAFACRARTERKAAFPAGARITVTPDAVPFAAVDVAFPAASREDDVLLYKVEIARKTAEGWEIFARSDTMGEFSLRPQDRKGAYAVPCSGGFFTSGETYRITARPVGFFGALGEPISCEWTAPAAIATELVWKSTDPMKECPFHMGREKPVEACLKLPILAPKDGWISYNAWKSGYVELPTDLWKGPKGTKYRMTVDLEFDQPSNEGCTVNIREITGWAHPCYGFQTPGGKSGPLRFVFDFAKSSEEEPVYGIRFERGGDFRVKLYGISVERIK